MPVVLLNSSHAAAVKQLFQHDKYMGVELPADSNLNQVTYDIFCDTYLTGLSDFHAYGYEVDGEIKSLISFYESHEEPAWYYTLYRSSGDNSLLREVLDYVIKYNEDNSRFKFYTLVHSNHSKLLRRFHWSKLNDERYDYIDELTVPSRCKCIYTNYWELLFKKTLLPEDSTVRCNFLKQQYRTHIPVGGNL